MMDGYQKFMFINFFHIFFSFSFQNLMVSLGVQKWKALAILLVGFFFFLMMIDS